MSSSIDTHSRNLAPEDLTDLGLPKNVRISPSGRQVVYSLMPATVKGDRPVSSIWLGQVGEPDSARQLTSGLYNDVKPCFSIDEDFIAFVSDRAKPGDSSAIYLLPLKSGEAYPVTTPENKGVISSFSWSPDGKKIAFLSTDETSPDTVARLEERDDAKVYGEGWEYNRLRLLNISTGKVTTLFAKDYHVNEFAWSEDGAEIAYSVHTTPDMNSASYHGTVFERVSIADEKSSRISDFPGNTESLVWHKDELLFLAGVNPTAPCTATMVYSISVKEGSWSKHSHGEENCVDSLSVVGDEVAVHVLHGLNSQIHLLGKLILYDETIQVETWAVVATKSGHIITMCKSSTSQPFEVYSFKDGKACQLSSHNSSITELEIGTSTIISCKASDGTHLDAVFMAPSTSSKPYPTVMVPHGGPYSRSTISFDTPYYHWTPWLLSLGYAVLLPNYRGSSGRGEEFAAAAGGGMGGTDYSDSIDTLNAAIADGLVDKEKVMIGGWSQGGYLSYLAVARDDFPFRGAICGAGVSEWDMVTMTSDNPFVEAGLSGGAPWEKTTLSTREKPGSAIWALRKKPGFPVLILHGEADRRIPVGQAVAFHRALLHWGAKSEMVLYPREQHEMRERLHWLDMLKRLERFVGECLK